MSDLLYRSFSRFRDGGDSHAIEVSSDGGGAGVNLDKFFEDAQELESLHQRLQSCHEHIKTLHNARAVKDLRAWMEWDVGEALKKAKAVEVRLEALERGNAANQNLPGCGPGSSSDRTRTSVVDGLGKKLKDNIEGFNKLREKLSSEKDMERNLEKTRRLILLVSIVMVIGVLLITLFAVKPWIWCNIVSPFNFIVI